MDLAVVNPGLVGCPSRFALSTERGKDSRLPPNCEGGKARTEAWSKSVSQERRLRRWVEEASVRMEILSLRRLFAIMAL